MNKTIEHLICHGTALSRLRAMEKHSNDDLTVHSDSDPIVIRYNFILVFFYIQNYVRFAVCKLVSANFKKINLSLSVLTS